MLLTRTRARCSTPVLSCSNCLECPACGPLCKQCTLVCCTCDSEVRAPARRGARESVRARGVARPQVVALFGLLTADDLSMVRALSCVCSCAWPGYSGGAARAEF